MNISRSPQRLSLRGLGDRLCCGRDHWILSLLNESQPWAILCLREKTAVNRAKKSFQWLLSIYRLNNKLLFETFTFNCVFPPSALGFPVFQTTLPPLTKLDAIIQHGNIYVWFDCMCDGNWFKLRKKVSFWSSDRLLQTKIRARPCEHELRLSKVTNRNSWLQCLMSWPCEKKLKYRSEKTAWKVAKFSEIRSITWALNIMIPMSVNWNLPKRWSKGTWKVRTTKNDRVLRLTRD